MTLTGQRVEHSPPDGPVSDQIAFGDDDPRIAYNRAFFALLRVNRSLMPEITKSLRAIGIADPIWYEILLATEEAGADGIQMIALQRRLFLPQYALSRHVARIEAAGLIRREAMAGSGRGAGRAQILHVTDKGKGLHQQVWQVYVTKIQSALAPRLTTNEAYALTGMLNRLYD